MKIFLIDDDIICNFITQNVLQHAGLSTAISCFETAAEALDALLQDFPAHVPDLLFLDLNMTQMNGWDFLAALQPFQEKLLDRCRIYILTSSLSTDDLHLSRDIPLVAGFIHKPLTEADVQVIRSAWEEEN